MVRKRLEALERASSSVTANKPAVSSTLAVARMPMSIPATGNVGGRNHLIRNGFCPLLARYSRIIKFELNAMVTGKYLHMIVLMIPSLVGNPLRKGIARQGTCAPEVLAPHTNGGLGNHGPLSIIRESSPVSATMRGNLSGLRRLFDRLELDAMVARERVRVGITMK
jgi:hypothetical protein